MKLTNRYTRTLAERFEEKVDRSSGPDACHRWTGASHRGYGAIALNARKKMKAHRVAWLLAHGDPGEMHVLHACDNPSCVNVAHLRLGTNADNIADKVARGRASRIQGSRARRAKLTECDVREIRARHLRGEGTRSIAKSLPVSRSVVQRIVTGKQWRHVD